MPKIVKVMTTSNIQTYLNADNIIKFIPFDGTTSKSKIFLKDGTDLFVLEDVDEILNQIND